MPKIGFYIDHGIEARHFLLSGLISLITEKYSVVIFINKKINSVFLNDYLSDINVEIVKLKDIPQNKLPRFIMSFVRAFRNSRKRFNNIKIFSHFGGVSNSLRWYDFLTGNYIINYTLDYLARPLLTYLNYNSYLEKKVLESEIGHIYILEYGKSINNSLASVCVKNKIKVHVFINTLKTLFINDFIPFNLNRLFCWNSNQSKLFKRLNPALKSSVFNNFGSPFHVFLRNIAPDYVKKVLEKYKLDESRPIIIYPLIFEEIYSEEHLVIEKINTFFNSFKKENRPQLALRRNPFEENSSLVEYVKNFENIVVFDHFWERNKRLNWSIQAKEGELEWKALLHISSLMISYPSMGIIESIVCSTPVINIGFGEDGFENKKLSHIVHAPFIKEFENSDFVQQCLTFDSFKEKFKQLINYKKQISSEKISNSIDISKSDLTSFNI